MMDFGTHNLLVAIFFPLFWVGVIASFGKFLKKYSGWLALLGPVVSFFYIFTVYSQASVPIQEVIHFSWLPSMGINLTFLIDGLSLFYGFVVSGVGILIFFYASCYLDDSYKYHHRFYAYLLIFMFAMLGTVFSGNMMLLFIFWELTGIASFFLIGFLHDKAVSRAGARMALLVTGFTGLALLIGVVLSKQVFGTYDLVTILNQDINQAHPMMKWAFFFLILGAFGKSAQFPFHFWLPNAMAAPTPVSAYLHSAAMVKLGIFLCARIFPFFHNLDVWMPTLASIGIFTMFLGAVFAFMSHDLKAILAYSTVSQLGFLVAMYGVAKPSGVEHDFFHVANHVFYKGSLFMMVGIIDHAVHNRDLKTLRGFGKKFPVLAVAFLLSLLAMSGVPGTTGFLSKELLLTRLYHLALANGGYFWVLLVLFMMAALFLVAFSLRLFIKLFFGEMPESIKKHYHYPGHMIQLAPVVLSGCVLYFGLFSHGLDAFFQTLKVSSLHVDHFSHLAIWHGLNIPLLLSVGAIIFGTAIYFRGNMNEWNYSIPKALRFDEHFYTLVDTMPKKAKEITHLLRAHKPSEYLLIVVSFSTFLFLTVFYHFNLTPKLFLSMMQAAEVEGVSLFVFILTVLSVLGVVYFSSWLARLISLSIAGVCVTFYFILYKAPDLALTQILIETAGLLLILLFLVRFPKKEQEKDSKEAKFGFSHFFKVLVSLSVGFVAAGSILVFSTHLPKNLIGYNFIKKTLPLAEGMNAVNTILVDFRGYDTMGEISVLTIAMLGILGLLMRKRTTDE